MGSIITKDLIPATYNPRKDLKPGDAEYDKLKRSIEQFGYVEPVIWNKVTGHVVGGHQRLKVLMDMGIIEVECVIIEIDEEKEKALNIALNKISGDWDKDKLALLIADLQGVDFDVSLTGFDPKELDDLFKDTLKEGIHDDDFDVETELKKPAISKLGDIWTLGRHRLICGDSTKKETYDVLMNKKKANLCVTDPPYNVNYEGAAGKIKNDHMANDAFYQFLLDAFKYGVPPHAGLAYGLDRLVMLMAKCDSIRDVIAFPKVKDASCLLTNAPDVVDAKQLEELSIAIEEEQEV